MSHSKRIDGGKPAFQIGDDDKVLTRSKCERVLCLGFDALLQCLIQIASAFSASICAVMSVSVPNNG